MVRLDDVGLAGFGAGGLDNVGINCALGEPLYVVELARLGVEDLLTLYLTRLTMKTLEIFPPIKA